MTGSLKEGDEPRSETGLRITVMKLEYEKLDEPVKVYNLTVSDDHTYYVGSVGVLVHNVGACGVEDGSESTSTLTDAQKSRLNSLKNTINDHLTEGDFSGTLRDLQGNPVPDKKGGYFDHLHEMKNLYASLKKVKGGLEGSLKNPNLSDIDKALLQDGLNSANSYISRIQEMFKPYGGIE